MRTAFWIIFVLFLPLLGDDFIYKKLEFKGNDAFSGFTLKEAIGVEEPPFYKFWKKLPRNHNELDRQFYVHELRDLAINLVCHPKTKRLNQAFLLIPVSV